MDKVSKLTTCAMLTLGGLVLYFINSFLPWQKLGPNSFNEWRGIGVVAVLLGIALLVWETLPLVATRPSAGPVPPRLLSMGIAAALVLFTLLTTLTHNEFRKIWAWIGLILSIVVAAGVWMQAKDEGVEMPSLGGTGAGSSADTGTSTGAPPAPSGETPPDEPQS